MSTYTKLFNNGYDAGRDDAQAGAKIPRLNMANMPDVWIDGYHSGYSDEKERMKHNGAQPEGRVSGGK
jgi:hypothetical protein